MIDAIAHMLGFCAHGIDTPTIYALLVCGGITVAGWCRIAMALFLR
jgi:hypothetical protein